MPVIINNYPLHYFSGYTRLRDIGWEFEMMMKFICNAVLMQVQNRIYSVSQKKSPLKFFGNFSKAAGNFSTKFHTFIMRSYLR